nr:hypothetical protein [Tanacetum cinerariifolium]
MLHICPRVHGQSFDEPPFEEEILAFIRFLRHSAAIRTLIDNSTDDEAGDDEGKDGDDDEEDKGDDGEEGDGDDDEDDDGEEGDDDDDELEVERDDDKDDKEEGGDDEPEYDEEESDEETRDKESFDPIPKTLENSKDKGNGEEELRLNVGREEGHVEEEEEDELYRDSSSVSSQFVTSMLNPTLDVGRESIFETTLQMDVQTPTFVTPFPMTAPTMTPSTIATITTTSQVPILPTTALSTIIQYLPYFSSFFGFDNKLRTFEAKFSEFIQTNQFAGSVSAIPRIVQRYIDQRMNKAVKMAIQIQSDRLLDEAQKENNEFLKTVDDNMQKIIKEQVKEQVKVQVSKILPRIEQAVNEQLEAEVLTRSSHSSKTSFAVVADLFEMELKKILIEKIRRDDDADKDEEPSAGPDRGSKRRKEGKEPESASAPTETTTRSADRSTQGSRSRQALASESAIAEEPMQTTFQMEEPSHLEFDTELRYHLEEVFKATTYQLDWVNPEVQQYPYNLLKPLPLIPNNRGRRVIPFEHFINNGLEHLRGGYDKHALWGVSHWGRKRQHFYGFAVNRESARDVYSKRRIRHVEDLQLGVESYKKKLNLTKPDSYRSDLKHKEAYTAYSNPRGFIYQNKDKKNRLMRIDELHKFSDGTLTDVRTALDDRLKEIRMQYLLQSIWRKSDKEIAAAMI